MRVDPSNFDPNLYSAPSHNLYLKGVAAKTALQLAALVPTTTATNEISNSLSPGQANAFWVLKAASDLAQLYNTTNPKDQAAILQDLKNIALYHGDINVPHFDGTLQQLISMVTTNFNSGGFASLWDAGAPPTTAPLSSILYNWIAQNQDPSDPQGADFSNFPLSDDMFYFSTLAVNLLTSQNPQFSTPNFAISIFGSHGTANPGLFTAQFTQYIFAFFYQKSEKADGSVDMNEVSKNTRAYSDNLNTILDRLAASDPTSPQYNLMHALYMFGGTYTGLDGTTHPFDDFGSNADYLYDDTNGAWPPLGGDGKPLWSAPGYPVSSGALSRPPTDGVNPPNSLPQTWVIDPNSSGASANVAPTYTGGNGFNVFSDWETFMPNQNMPMTN